MVAVCRQLSGSPSCPGPLWLTSRQSCSGLDLALKQRPRPGEPSVGTAWEGFITFMFHHLGQKTQELEGGTAGRLRPSPPRALNAPRPYWPEFVTVLAM